MVVSLSLPAIGYVFYSDLQCPEQSWCRTSLSEQGFVVGVKRLTNLNCPKAWLVPLPHGPGAAWSGCRVNLRVNTLLECRSFKFPFHGKLEPGLD